MRMDGAGDDDEEDGKPMNEGNYAFFLLHTSKISKILKKN